MKAIYLLALTLGTFAPEAFARGGGSGWTGIIINRVTTTSLICTDARGNRLNFETKYEESNAGNSTKDRHLVRGEGGGSQNIDIRGDLAAEELNLRIYHFGTRSYEGAEVIATLKGSAEETIFEGSIPLSFQQQLAGPLSLKCELSKK